MRSMGLAVAGAVVVASLAVAAPLVPRIDSHDFNFGASEPAAGGGVPFYEPNGSDPDWLTLSADSLDREVTAFWEIWPVGGTPLPIFNAAGDFGGDLELYLQFDGEDADPPHLDVSLTGSGRQDGADLIIWGAIPDLGIPFSVLMAVDVEQASLYGYGGSSSFVLETAGVIVDVNPGLPGAAELLGQSAVSRGNIDFLSLALPSGYDPLVDMDLPPDGGAYSGEAGRGVPTPEPASLALLLVGLAMQVRWRTHPA